MFTGNALDKLDEEDVQLQLVSITLVYEQRSMVKAVSETTYGTIVVSQSCFIIAPRRLIMARSEQFDLIPDNGGPWGYTSSEHYQAGCDARVRYEGESHTATSWWRTGWADADSELRSRVAKLVVESKAEEVRWSNFGSGEQARICQLSFDENYADSWKQNWVQTDIAISLGSRRSNA
jgi:hypothetical protein